MLAEFPPLSSELKKQLFQLAQKSIRHGLKTGKPAQAQPDDLQGILAEKGASFVTLHKGKHLRGCIGALTPYRALAIDVLENAFASAFRDPRFSALQAEEYELLKIKISVLSPAQPMSFHSEADLLAQLRPGVDGLILSEGHQRGTFLPSVWEDLPKPEMFLNQLKRKGGLPSSYWSSTLQMERYTTEEFGESS